MGNEIEVFRGYNLFGEHFISEDEIPTQITSVLGTKNREIINTINVDLITNSLDKDYLYPFAPINFSEQKDGFIRISNKNKKLRNYDETFASSQCCS